MAELVLHGPDRRYKPGVATFSKSGIEEILSHLRSAQAKINSLSVSAYPAGFQERHYLGQRGYFELDNRGVRLGASSGTHIFFHNISCSEIDLAIEVLQSCFGRAQSLMDSLSAIYMTEPPPKQVTHSSGKRRGSNKIYYFSFLPLLILATLIVYFFQRITLISLAAVFIIIGACLLLLAGAYLLDKLAVRHFLSKEEMDLRISRKVEKERKRRKKAHERQQ